MQELSETRSEAVHQGCGRAARQGSFLEGSNGSQGPRWWWELCPEILTQKEVTGRFSHINSKQSGSAAERLVQRSWGEERKKSNALWEMVSAPEVTVCGGEPSPPGCGCTQQGCRDQDLAQCGSEGWAALLQCPSDRRGN